MKSEAVKQFKYLDIITVMFVAVLLISNIAATKIINYGYLSSDGGIVLFPLAYIFGDILTEVYGFKRSRRVIWLGFAANLLMAVTLMVVNALPPASDWPFNEAWNNILGLTPRIVLGSLVAYFAGEFVNSFVLAKLKIITKGKMLWARTIGSTVVGELVDTVVMVLIAFYGVFSTDLLLSMIVTGYLVKCGVEIIFTPITYWIVNFLKKKEHEDYYDYKTDFNPFLIKQ
jgi:queuosine precursor transporter